VAAVDLQRANSRIIIDDCVRVPPHRRPLHSASESGISRLPVRGVAGNPCTQLVNATAHRYVCWTSKVKRLARTLVQSYSDPIQIRLREGLHRGYTSILTDRGDL
jgi:hypothetical protein